MKKIDCRGLLCPEPTRRIKKYFNSIGEGEAIVIVDNEISNSNIYKYAMSKGYQVESTKINEDLYELMIEKRGCLEVLEEESNLVILISSDKLGNGDEVLGKLLMKDYFIALSEDEKQPKQIIFLNSGVKLLIDDSEIMESIQLLNEKGVEILYSGTSVDFYKIKDKIILGDIRSMYDIVEIMNNCDNLIKL